MTPTIKEIAKRAKVSIATVSRVLNNDQRVTEKTRDIVLRVSKELNYKPNILARNFVKKKSNVIGLLLPESSDEFFTEIIKGVDEVTYTHGYYTLVASSHKYRTLDESILTFMQNGIVGGMILLVSSLNNNIKEILDQSKIPIVMISGHNETGKYDAVSIDNYQGAFDITEYLIVKKGFTKIAHISGPLDNDDALLRKRGFLDACRKHNLAINNSWIIKGDFTRETGESACNELLKMKTKPQIIFAANDMMALGCYDAASKAGIKIPEDIGIAGFDDIFVAKYLSPGLTTVRVQIEEVGKTAAEILMKKIQGRNGSSHPVVKISTQLVIRGSC
ncbi:MAG: LacI family DNA-binding transcriptional regulator [Ignavibacteria bacterium]|nr:LacI family DNA-binding transcriptional regulator [Ignavibacteria bacterium]